MIRYAFIAFAALGIAFKILVGTSPDPRDTAELLDKATVFLADSGYRVDATSLGSEVVIQAHRGSCGLLLLETRPQGWNRARIHELAKDAGSLKFVYDGELLDQVPVFRATLNYQLARLSRSLAIDIEWHQVWAVVADAKCASDAIPWSDLLGL